MLIARRSSTRSMAGCINGSMVNWRLSHNTGWPTCTSCHVVTQKKTLAHATQHLSQFQHSWTVYTDSPAKGTGSNHSGPQVSLPDPSMDLQQEVQRLEKLRRSVQSEKDKEITKLKRDLDDALKSNDKRVRLTGNDQNNNAKKKSRWRPQRPPRRQMVTISAGGVGEASAVP